MSAFATTQRALPNLRTPPDGLRLDAAHVPSLQPALRGAVDCLLSRQEADGHWVGELQGDTILESEYVLLMAFLERDQLMHFSRR